MQLSRNLTKKIKLILKEFRESKSKIKKEKYKSTFENILGGLRLGLK